MLTARLIARRFAAILWTAFAILAITAGVIVGVGRMLLPFADHLEPRLEAWLSEEFRRPVQIGDIGAAWNLTGPELRLSGVRFIDPATGATGLTLSQAQVDVNLLAWLLPDTAPLSFAMAQTELALVRGPGGEFSVRGLGTRRAAGDGRALQWLLRQGRISLVDAKVRYLDRVQGLAWVFDDVDIVLDNRGDTHYILGTMQLAGASGRLEWRIRLVGAPRPGGQSAARFYVTGENLKLPAWFQQARPGGLNVQEGRAEFRIWGQIRDNRLAQLRGTISLDGLAVGSAGANRLAAEPFTLHELQGRFLWEALPQGWRLSGEDVRVARAGHSWPRFGFTLERDTGLWRFGADYLRLADVAAAARTLPSLPAPWRAALAQLAPEGVLRDFAANWLPGLPPGRAVRATARLEGVAWRPLGKWPGLRGVSGQLRIQGGMGRLTLNTPALQFALPSLFRQPLSLEAVHARLNWHRAGDGWVAAVPALTAQARKAEIAARLRMVFQGDGSRPFINLRGRLSGARVPDAKAFWPVGIMPDDVVRWLDQALVDGRLERGRVLAFGDLDHWPFDQGAGRFAVHGEVADATLDYQNGWPRVSGARAEVRFEGRSMTIEAHSGRVRGIRVDRATAHIEDLEMALLQLDVQGHGGAGELLDFLRQSPLSDEYGAYLQGLSAAGPGRVRTRLALPLDDAAGSRSVTGDVWLDGVQLQGARWDITLADVTGHIQFDQDGFVSDGLKTTFLGEPASLAVRVGAQAPASLLAQAVLRGNWPAARLLDRYAMLQPIETVVSGRADWQIRVRLPDSGSADATAAHLRLESNLAGIGVALPAPLGKPAPKHLPFALEMPLPMAGGVLQFHYGDRLAVNLWPGAPGGMRGHLRFGAMHAELPDQNGIFVSGDIGRLNVDGWYRLLGTVGADGAGALVERVNLRIAELKALGRLFASVRVQGEHSAGTWRLRLDGEGVAGTLRLPSDESAGLVGDFDTLVLGPVEPGKAGMTLDPRQLPALHLAIDNFTFGKAQLGSARLEAYPLPDGLRVELLRTENANLGVQADGIWIAGAEGSQRSSFDFTITAQSLGSMLANFGYAGLVEDGPTVAHLNVQWSGSPANFALKRASGTLQVETGAGRLVPVDPGAGRIFGLLSLQALPRRLILDFSDLFGEGLSFDSITGSFQFDEGVARTDDLLLKGPAARIEVTGTINMVEQTYDQLVTIYPSVGTALPLVGALTGGVPGAAALFVIQSLFQEQIQDLASYRYAVTGPWQDPNFELLEPASPEVSTIEGPQPSR